MYSLYRAWFGGEETYPRLETLSPPDTLVRVGNEGEHQFVAHRGVLAAHSGYLKALLATSTSSSREDPTCPTVTSVSVSSVGGEAFAPLLNYMYTGRLEVTLENIYSVLLATHLLHMPGALEQCRAALLRLRGPPPGLSETCSSQGPTPPVSTTVTTAPPGAILRPVPNRLVGPPLCWPQPALYPSPSHVGLTHLTNFQLSPELSILSNPRGILRGPTTTALPYSYRGNSRSSSPPQSSLDIRRSENPEVSNIPDEHDESVADDEIENESVGRGEDGGEGDEDEEDEEDEEYEEQLEKVKETTAGSIQGEKRKRRRRRKRRRTERMGNDDDGIAVSNERSSNLLEINIDRSVSTTIERTAKSQQGGNHVVVIVGSPKSRNPEGSASTSNGTGTGVIFDVACCDGPVKFHRVLNENYVATSRVPGRRVTRTDTPSEDDLEIRRFIENDENGKPETTTASIVTPARCTGNVGTSDGSGGNNSSGALAPTYTCGYCRHTFKSHYCYRKHARRHLLPGSGGGETGRLPTTTPSPNRSDGRRREVKLLDLNVQYYPCKICGSKFPSYYFVHKHKKLCHANVEGNPGNIPDGESTAVADAAHHIIQATNNSTDSSLKNYSRDESK